MPKEIKLKRDTSYYLREDLYDALERYLNNGINPGSFLTAVLENNLVAAFSCADHDNKENLHNIIGYIYNHFPSKAWGSAEEVIEYLESLRRAA